MEALSVEAKKNILNKEGVSKYDYDEEKEYLLYVVGTSLGRHPKHKGALMDESRGHFKKDNYVIITEDFINKYYPKFVGGYVDINHSAFVDKDKTGALNQDLVVGEVIDYFYNTDGFTDSKGNVYKDKKHIGQPIFVLKIQKDKLEYEDAKELDSSSMGYYITSFTESDSETGIGGVVVDAIDVDKDNLSITLASKGINYTSNRSVVLHSVFTQNNLNDNQMENPNEKDIVSQEASQEQEVKQSESDVSLTSTKLSEIAERLSAMEEKLNLVVEKMSVSQSQDEEKVAQSQDEEEKKEDVSQSQEQKQAVAQSQNISSFSELIKSNKEVASQLKSMTQMLQRNAVAQSNDLTQQVKVQKEEASYEKITY